MPDIELLANITPPLDQLIGRLNLSELGIERLAANAINKSLPSVRTRITGDLADEVNLKVGDIRDQFGLSRAKIEADPTGKIDLTRKPIPIEEFLGGHQEDAGYMVEVRQQTGEELLPRAFLATMPTGHELVAQRERRGGDVGQGANLTDADALVGRLPLRPRYGPALTAILTHVEDLMQREVDQAGQILQKNVANQIEYLISSGRVAGLAESGEPLYGS